MTALMMVQNSTQYILEGANLEPPMALSVLARDVGRSVAQCTACYVNTKHYLYNTRLVGQSPRPRSPLHGIQSITSIVIHYR